MGKLFTPCTMVVLYALAMAWVESAVVFYMRSMIQRIIPYQADPLPVAGGFGLAELVREASTLIMLLTVGMLAGRTWRSRFGFTLLAFGIWDMAYYLWLLPLTGWPRSLGDWDILFLIPLPWWGPVWAPVSIAALMVCFGWLVGNHDTPERPLWPNRLGVLSALTGVLLALTIFLVDSLGVILSGGGLDELRKMLPQDFNWLPFTLALLALSVPVFQVFSQWRPGAARNPRLYCENLNRVHQVSWEEGHKP